MAKELYSSGKTIKMYAGVAAKTSIFVAELNMMRPNNTRTSRGRVYEATDFGF